MPVKSGLRSNGGLLSIEALQLWFIKGFSEVDDVMNNTVGVLLDDSW